VDEKYLEQAARLEQTQRDTSVRSAQRQLGRKGQPDCAGCGEAIPPQRRTAVPSAIRCIQCQSAFERLKGLGL
jgi:phage/conjugal plasmid C-4 type zinc finger TraR family protein